MQVLYYEHAESPFRRIVGNLYKDYRLPAAMSRYLL
jgi:hypothetical protein